MRTARFSRPYLARYLLRFVLGIVLGVLFGASNSVSLGSIWMIAYRLDDPAHVEKLTREGREIKAQKDEGEGPVVHGLKAKTKVLKEELYYAIDPWLPLKNRPLDWRQCLGGLLLIPLTALLRGSLGYGSSYLLAWSGQRITNDVKRDAFRKVSSLSLDFFHRTTTSELLSRIESDGANINNFLKLGLSDLVKEPSTVFFPARDDADHRLEIQPYFPGVRAALRRTGADGGKKNQDGSGARISPPTWARATSRWNRSRTSGSRRPTLWRRFTRNPITSGARGPRTTT